MGPDHHPGSSFFMGSGLRCLQKDCTVFPQRGVATVSPASRSWCNRNWNPERQPTLDWNDRGRGSPVGPVRFQTQGEKSAATPVPGAETTPAPNSAAENVRGASALHRARRSHRRRPGWNRAHRRLLAHACCCVPVARPPCGQPATHSGLWFQSLFGKALGKRGTGLGVPRLRGPLVEGRTNRANAELQTGVFKLALSRSNSDQPRQVNHRDAMNTEKTKPSGRPVFGH